MKTLTAVSHGFSEFVLFDENQQHLGKIEYQKWYSFDTKISTPQGNSTVKMEGFWKSKIVQYDQNNKEITNVKQTWTGFIFKKENSQEFLLSWKGFWGNRFVLMDPYKRELITFEMKFEWKKFNSNYEIKIADGVEFSNDFILLIIHCINYQMMIAAGTS